MVQELKFTSHNQMISEVLTMVPGFSHLGEIVVLQCLVEMGLSQSQVLQALI